MEKDDRYLIVVLNDEDTYTGVDDCTLRVNRVDSEDDDNGIPDQRLTNAVYSPEKFQDNYNHPPLKRPLT